MSQIPIRHLALIALGALVIWALVIGAAVAIIRALEPDYPAATPSGFPLPCRVVMPEDLDR